MTTTRDELQASMDGLNAAIDRRLAEIAELRKVLERAKLYAWGRAVTCGCTLRNDNTTGESCDECNEAWDLYHEIRQALNARRAGEGE